MSDGATLLAEAHFDAWESLAAALNVGKSAAPRAEWLRQHLKEYNLEIWAVVAHLAPLTLAPAYLSLRALYTWEVEAATHYLTPRQLGEQVVHAGRRFGVESLLRQSAQHTVWQAGQLAALPRMSCR